MDDYIDWKNVHWIRFMIHARDTFEIRKPISCGGCKALRIKEELSQKWIIFKGDYIRGAKGVVKGRLNWKQIQNDIYAREAKLDESDDIIDEEKLFFMRKLNFDRMMNISKAKESTKKIPDEYRSTSFGIIFEFVSRLVLSQKELEYFEDSEIDIVLDQKRNSNSYK
jgi:hypothetical protein